MHENGHKNLLTNKACFGCTIACGRIAHIDKDHFTIVNRPEYRHASGGLEYETAYAFGPVVGVDDIDALTFAGYLMNEHGMDPISFGATLSAAMELFELGVITDRGDRRRSPELRQRRGPDGDGGEDRQVRGLRPGARDSARSLLCEKYGRPELSMTVKGQEFAGYDSRALQGMGLGYATSNRGACHLKHDVFAEDMEDQTGKGKAQTLQGFARPRGCDVDSSGLCLFTTAAWGLAEFAEAARRRLRRATGRKPALIGNRRAGLEPGAAVQPGRRPDRGGRHPAQAHAGGPHPQRHRQGQGERSADHAAGIL